MNMMDEPCMTTDEFHVVICALSKIRYCVETIKDKETERKKENDV